MRKYLLKLVILLVVICLGVFLYFTFDKNVQIVLTAPSTCKIGELVVLDVSESNASSFKWRVIPETLNFRIVGKRAFFTSGMSGSYLFFVSAAKGGSVDSTIHEIQVDSKSDDFTIMVKSWLPKKNDPLVLKALARSFESAAARAKDVVTLVNTTAVANKAVLGPNLEQYKPFLIEFSKYLQENYQDASLEKHTELWLRIAKILKSC